MELSDKDLRRARFERRKQKSGKRSKNRLRKAEKQLDRDDHFAASIELTRIMHDELQSEIKNVVDTDLDRW